MSGPELFDFLWCGLPASPEAERFVLGGVLIDSTHMEKIRDLLTPEDFSVRNHGRIWARLCGMYDAGNKIDRLTLATSLDEKGELLAVGGMAFLVDLEDGMPRLANLGSWVEIIRRKAIKRAAILRCHHAAVRLANTDDEETEIFAEMERTLSDLSGKLQQSGNFRTPAEIVRDAGGTDKYLQRRSEAGLPSPFPTLNRMTGGFRPGELIVVAAKTGGGKTALAINFAAHFASHGHAGAIFSMEMDAEEINDRIISTNSTLDSKILRQPGGALSDADRRARVSRAVAAAGELPIFISDKARFTVPAMSAELRRLAARRKIEYVIVDYIQLAEAVGRFDKRADEVASITRGLKRLASELRIPVIALSQFNRDHSKENREPQLHDLRESGSIEQDANLVIMVHFTRAYDVNVGINTGEAKLLVRKQRNGPVGFIPVFFHAPSGRFDEREESLAPAKAAEEVTDGKSRGMVQ
jgi:replicative DNA helicase